MLKVTYQVRNQGMLAGEALHGNLVSGEVKTQN